jgi:4-hydroxy-3-polyprenylbenzoate decarboxylase
MKDFSKFSKFLKTISTPLDVELEIPHLAYLEAKKEEPKILIFTRPHRRGKELKIPVVMNLYANGEVVREIFGEELEKIANRIEKLVKLRPPSGWSEKIETLKNLSTLYYTIPKRVKKGVCQEVIFRGDEVDLFQLPILKTWELDGGPFITAGQVYTRSLDGKIKNVGLYRLQVYSKNRLGLHWQIHKDGNHLFWEYKKAGKKMPVSIAIGGDPLYLWGASAPLPPGIFELALVGFIRKKRVELVESVTNPVEVPADADIVIEGWCDPEKMELEGMFGDHTGYYTLPEYFPVLEVSAITMKKNPYYYATVVGKPPLEDKWLGYATERLFLPLLKLTTPALVDYALPENGVFHNLLIGKIAPRYPGHSLQIAHSLWGVGQMSFLKNAIFVGEDAPPLREYEKLIPYILERFTPDAIFTSQGVVDQLDHSSSQPLIGGKIGVDVAQTAGGRPTPPQLLPDRILLSQISQIWEEMGFFSRPVALKTYFSDTPNPITLLQIEKRESASQLLPPLAQLKNHLRILALLNTPEVENPYMAVWRITNNIDGERDIYRFDPMVAIDGTNKSREIDNFPREWPPDVDTTPEVIGKLQKLGLVELTPAQMEKYQIKF